MCSPITCFLWQVQPVTCSSLFVSSCRGCGESLNLNSSNLYPPDFYFEAGNKGTLSFDSIDESKFQQQREKKFMPFFETRDYWGIERTRTKLLCKSCGALVGYIYDDGPPVNNNLGQHFMGPSQVVPRYKRYRMKIKSLQQETQFYHWWWMNMNPGTSELQQSHKCFRLELRSFIVVKIVCRLSILILHSAISISHWNFDTTCGSGERLWVQYIIVITL